MHTSIQHVWEHMFMFAGVDGLNKILDIADFRASGQCLRHPDKIFGCPYVTVDLEPLPHSMLQALSS